MERPPKNMRKLEILGYHSQEEKHSFLSFQCISITSDIRETVQAGNPWKNS
jgi:hypothetical protein